jgi:hypothetical protein
MKFWEIVFAPSIIQKKFFVVLGSLDRKLGGYGFKIISACEHLFFGKINIMHKSSLFVAEEDEFLFLHIFSSAFLFVVFPFVDELTPYMRFDEEVPPEVRARNMAFYKRCVQKHLFEFGKGRKYLTKNPSFAPKVVSLREEFPDSHIVCMVRNPLEAVPSGISLDAYYFNLFMSPLEPYPMREFICDMTAYMYRYPVDKLQEWPPSLQTIVRYDDLIGDPEAMVLKLYQRFDFTLSDRFRDVLRDEKRKASTYKSQHTYSLEEIGLTRENIITQYKDIFERFGFAIPGDSTKSNVKKN